MTRLSRKNRTDIVYKGHGGITDAFDDVMKFTWRISDEEYDYICEYASFEALDYFVGDLNTFTEKRQALIILNKLLNDMR